MAAIVPLGIPIDYMYSRIFCFIILNFSLNRSRPIAASTACTTAHSTINSYGMHSHTHTLNSSHGTGTVSVSGVVSSGGGGSSSSHQQPDILKSTPDHQRIK